MSKVFVSDINLSNIADAIRTKNGAQTQYYPREMAAAITALDVEEHKPIQVNIQQSEHQTIKVKVKQKELNNTTINANVELPETIQLEATVTADEGYTPGTLNQSLVNAEWGDTVTFNVTEATVELQPNILMTLNEDIDTSGTISYSVLVENTGDVDLTDVEIACEETGNQWTIGSLPIDDNQAFDLADSDSNTIVVTATSGSYSTSQTFHVKIPTEIEAYAEDVTVGDTQIIHGQILPNSATGSVYIDASEFNRRVSISEGSFIVSFTTYAAGSSNCTITYEGDDNHQPSVFEFTYEVSPKPIII